MRVVYEFDQPERFVAGTVGQPGERTFFLQAKEGARVIAVSLEKMQVAALAERIVELLPQVHAESHDEGALEVPVVEEFRVGALGISWNPITMVLTIEAQAITEDDTDDVIEGAEGPDLFRVHLSAPQAVAFAARAQVVVAAGRQPCPFCSLPLDPQGHICPRANGYRR